MNRLPLVFQPSFSIGVFHLEATLTISFTVLTWLSMYTNLLSLVALLTYFPFLYIWILPAWGLNCHFLNWKQMLPLLWSQGRWLYLSLDTFHILLCIWSVLYLLYLSLVLKNVRLEIISGLCLSSPKPCAHPRCFQNSYR